MFEHPYGITLETADVYICLRYPGLSATFQSVNWYSTWVNRLGNLIFGGGKKESAISKQEGSSTKEESAIPKQDDDTARGESAIPKQDDGSTQEENEGGDPDKGRGGETKPAQEGRANNPPPLNQAQICTTQESPSNL
jgi:hypothetical protein